LKTTIKFTIKKINYKKDKKQKISIKRMSTKNEIKT